MLGALDGTRVLDLYAGSGALGIEALSRGASEAVMVESARPALAALRQNIASLELRGRATVIASDVMRARTSLVRAGPFDLLLVDPPYASVADGSVVLLLAALLAAGVGKPGGTLMLEHASRDDAPKITGTTLERARIYGDSGVAIYRVEEAPGVAVLASTEEPEVAFLASTEEVV